MLIEVHSQAEISWISFSSARKFQGQVKWASKRCKRKFEDLDWKKALRFPDPTLRIISNKLEVIGKKKDIFYQDKIKLDNIW